MIDCITAFCAMHSCSFYYKASNERPSAWVSALAMALYHAFPHHFRLQRMPIRLDSKNRMSGLQPEPIARTGRHIAPPCTLPDDLDDWTRR